MKVYFISGLGADEKAFQALDLPAVEKIHLSWIPPLHKESIESYARRMAESIVEENPIIIGLSFGGMMAIEIAKIISVQQIIIISSAKGKKELPPYFSVCRYIPFHKILPVRAISLNEKAMLYIFGTRNEEQKKNLINIIHNTVEGFNHWAIDRIVKWKNTEVPKNLIHIHGEADKLLPIGYVKADFTIANGGHFMIVNQAKDISTILQKLLSNKA
jgi:pimeloyl-ACP methyl ester carboxylesterase